MMNGAAYSKDAVALSSRHAQKLRDEWQCRLLGEAKDKNLAIVLAMLANLYYEAMEVLLRVAFPGFVQIKPPIYTGFARILKDGRVVCDYVDRDMSLTRNALVYDSEDQLIKAFRDIADRLKLADEDRLRMFADLKKWVSRDDRIRTEGE